MKAKKIYNPMKADRTLRVMVDDDRPSRKVFEARDAVVQALVQAGIEHVAEYAVDAKTKDMVLVINLKEQAR